MRRMFRAGEHVLVKTVKLQYVAQFHGMFSKQKAVVFVTPESMEDDGIRLVMLKSLHPYYDAPTDQQRRARHAARMFKQGIRWFRLGGPNGTSFNVDLIGADTAFGRKRKCKTILQVPLHDLWPETVK